MELRSAALVLLALAFAPAGAIGTGTGEARATRAAAGCPSSRPTTSTGARGGAAAPPGATSATFCIYTGNHLNRARRLAPGPLSRALNHSRASLPPRTACTTEARPPALVALGYPDGGRQFVVLDTGGCPGLITSNGRRRFFLGAARDTIVDAFARTWGG